MILFYDMPDKYYSLYSKKQYVTCYWNYTDFCIPIRCFFRCQRPGAPWTLKTKPWLEQRHTRSVLRVCTARPNSADDVTVCCKMTSHRHASDRIWRHFLFVDGVLYIFLFFYKLLRACLDTTVLFMAYSYFKID